jgi:hypothetical protein
VVAVVLALLCQFYSFAGCVIPNASTGVPQVVFPNTGVALDFQTIIVWCFVVHQEKLRMYLFLVANVKYMSGRRGAVRAEWSRTCGL